MRGMAFIQPVGFATLLDGYDMFFNDVLQIQQISTESFTLYDCYACSETTSARALRWLGAGSPYWFVRIGLSTESTACNSNCPWGRGISSISGYDLRIARVIRTEIGPQRIAISEP